MPSELWFRARRYGWSWTPATWQGWAVTVVYLVAVVGWVVYLMSRPDATVGWHYGAAAWLAALPILLLTAVLLGICWLKGERPRWRWGK
jgi:hypothetical protein